MGSMAEFQGSLPPHAIEAEASLLGGLLLDNRVWEHVSDVVVDSDFYRYEHRLIYAAVAKLITASRPADVITVYEELQRQGKAEETGGLPYLNSLAEYLPSTDNLRVYAGLVRQKAQLRQIAAAAAQARGIAMSDAVEPHIAIEQALRLLSGIDARHGDREPQRVDALAITFLDRINDLASGRAQPGSSTGFPGIDRRIGGGLKPGRQVVIAARPGVGKTSLTAQILLNLAKSGVPCMLISLELSNDELMDRLVATVGRVALDGISTGQLSEEAWSRVAEGVERLRGLPLFLHPGSALSLTEIRSLARKMVRQHGVKVIALDYVQLCSANRDKRYGSRHHELEELSRGLKALAMELGVCTLVLSQLNRDVERRVAGRPMLADLKESGSLEEDADVVLLLSGDGDLDGGVAVYADVAKSRGGQAGVCRLQFEKQFQAWSELAGEYRRPAPMPRKRLTNEI